MKCLAYKKQLLLIILTILCLICCSCTKQNEENKSVTNISDHQPQNADQNEGSVSSPASPPEMLLFYSYEQYVEFKESVNLSDKDFKLFIKSNDFDMNGINSKDDVKTLCAQIDSLPVPNPQQLSLSEMIVYVDRQECLLKYITADDVICSYLIFYNETELTSFNSVKQNSNLKAISIVSEDVSDVYYVNNESNDNMEAYYTLIDDYLVLFRVYDTTSSNALELLKSVNYNALAVQ